MALEYPKIITKRYSFLISPLSSSMYMYSPQFHVLLSRFRLVATYDRRLLWWPKAAYVIAQDTATSGIAFCLYPFIDVIDDFAVKYPLTG
jgi:hypothetical protein